MTGERWIRYNWARVTRWSSGWRLALVPEPRHGRYRGSLIFTCRGQDSRGGDVTLPDMTLLGVFVKPMDKLSFEVGAVGPAGAPMTS